MTIFISIISISLLNAKSGSSESSTQFVWTTIPILLDQVGVSSGTRFVFTAGNHFAYIDN